MYLMSISRKQDMGNDENDKKPLLSNNGNNSIQKQTTQSDMQNKTWKNLFTCKVCTCRKITCTCIFGFVYILLTLILGNTIAELALMIVIVEKPIGHPNTSYQHDPLEIATIATQGV